MFTWSDAWLLLAVAYASHAREPDTSAPASLQDVIACGDAIQHAIFTPAELRRGAAKLLAGGHINVEGGRWSLTPAMASEYRRLTEGVQGILDSQEVLERFLRAAPYPAGDPNFEDPLWSLPSLSDAEITEAVEGWHVEAGRIADEPRRDPEGA